MFVQLILFMSIFEILRSERESLKLIVGNVMPITQSQAGCWRIAKDDDISVYCKTLIEGFKYINREILKVTESESQSLSMIKVDILLSTTSVIHLNESVVVEKARSLRISSINGTAMIEGNSCEKETAGVDLEFSNIVELVIENVRFHCLGQFGMHDDDDEFCRHSSIIFKYIKTLKIANVTVSDCASGGMCVHNVSESFTLISSHISNSSWSENQNTTGGLWISIGPANNTQFIIDNCTFKHNKADKAQATGTSERYYAHGGGLLLNMYMRCNAIVSISDTVFHGNSAAHGGGMAIKVPRKYPNSSLSVVMSGCNFTHNIAEGSMISNGGGLQLILYSMNNISILVYNTSFISNTAYLGGGTSITATYGKGKNKILIFTDCTWKNNSASSGAAVDIRRTFYDKHVAHALHLIPVLEQCTFTSNMVDKIQSKPTSHYIKESIGHGVLSVVLMHVSFNGSVDFSNNSGSALSGVDTVITFNCSKGANFYQNIGINGGAISLEAFSKLDIQNGTQLSFVNNQAHVYGGAIYFYIPSDHMLLMPSMCLFTKHLLNNDTQVTLYFENNVAQVNGNSMYFTSLIPCVHEFYSETYNNFSNELEKVKNLFKHKVFESADSILSDHNATVDVATAPSDFSKMKEIYVPPGAKTPLKIHFRDNFNHSVRDQKVLLQSFKVTSFNQTHRSMNHSTIICSSKEEALLTGQKSQTWELLLQTINKPTMNILTKVHMDKCCPPGYKFNDTLETCVCIRVQTRKFLHFSGECLSNGKFAAFIQPNTWIGYIEADGVSEPVFVSALCYWFCKYHEYEKPIPKLVGDNYTSYNHILDQYTCLRNRIGTMCSTCTNNTTAAYNRDHYCIKDGKCKYGWIWLIIVDFLPLTIMILVVMIFKINIASGYIQGFLLYTHILSSISIYPKTKPKFIKKITYYSIHFVYRSLNLRFSNYLQPFCLFRRATALDNTAMLYLSIAYSLLLILAVVAFMRCFNVRLRNINRMIRFTTVKSSAVHGLLAVFLLSYTRCIETALLILQPVTFYKLDEKSDKDEVTVDSYRVALHGEYYYFSRYHLKYAIPALINLTISLIPSLMLITYPFAIKLQAYYNIELRYPKTSYMLSKIFMYNTFKPFYDLFYSPFQDNYRHFAGLYLLYRILVALMYYFSQESDSLIMIELLLVLFLGIHSIAQPYTQRCHNIIDSLLLFDLVMINGFSVLVYIVNEGNMFIDRRKKQCGEVIQVIGIVLPVVIVISVVVYHYILKKCWRFCTGRYRYSELNETHSLMHHRSMGKSSDFTKYE